VTLLGHHHYLSKKQPALHRWLFLPSK